MKRHSQLAKADVGNPPGPGGPNVYNIWLMRYWIDKIPKKVAQRCTDRSHNT